MVIASNLRSAEKLWTLVKDIIAWIGLHRWILICANVFMHILLSVSFQLGGIYFTTIYIGNYANVLIWDINHRVAIAKVIKIVIASKDAIKDRASFSLSFNITEELTLGKCEWTIELFARKQTAMDSDEWRKEWERETHKMEILCNALELCNANNMWSLLANYVIHSNEWWWVYGSTLFNWQMVDRKFDIAWWSWTCRTTNAKLYEKRDDLYFIYAQC